MCSKGAIPFVIGGGNDQSYPNARGMMNTLDDSASVLVVNVDAHLDVRPLKVLCNDNPALAMRVAHR